jgi:hypothetical protein
MSLINKNVFVIIKQMIVICMLILNWAATQTYYLITRS